MNQHIIPILDERHYNIADSPLGSFLMFRKRNPEKKLLQAKSDSWLDIYQYWAAYQYWQVEELNTKSMINKI